MANSSASSQDWQRGDDFDADEDDITTTLHGAKAITGKAVYSANQAARNLDQSSSQQAHDEKHEAVEREMRELAHLATWNAEKTFVGGVEMTNEEAQNARRHVIDNLDYYADKAVRDGLINENEKDDFKRKAVRKYELEDKRGRGTITGAEDREERENDKSHSGEAFDALTGKIHQARGIDQSLTVQRNDANTSLRGTTSRDVDFGDKELFQSAPKVNAAFASAASPNQPEISTVSAPAPIDPRIRASGLNL